MHLASTERTRLFVAGVRNPITADVAGRRDDAMIVRQALPFLRLETPVTGADGRRARISRVAIAMDGDVPSLLLELQDETANDADEAVAICESDRDLDAFLADVDGTRADDTIASFTPGVSERPARTDSTVPYVLRAEDRPSREVVVGAALVVGSPPPPAVAVVEPLFTRLARELARAVTRFFSALTRPTPALPR